MSKKEIGDKTSTEIRCSISSLLPNTQIGEHAIRSHLGIENFLHWVLDVEFNEDHLRVRRGKDPENLAIVRHVAINLLKQVKIM